MEPLTNRHIFIIGLPGSGKSKYGKKLANYLGWEYLDSDTVIETSEGKSIIQLFEESGETYFRYLERHFLDQIPQDKKYVISTGGGLPCYNDSLQKMKELGRIIYLQVPPEILVSRIQEENLRPMFLQLEPTEILKHLKELLSKRQKDYLQADETLIFDKEDMWKKLKRLMVQWNIKRAS